MSENLDEPMADLGEALEAAGLVGDTAGPDASLRDVPEGLGAADAPILWALAYQAAVSLEASEPDKADFVFATLRALRMTAALPKGMPLANFSTPAPVTKSDRRAGG